MSAGFAEPCRTPVLRSDSERGPERRAQMNSGGANVDLPFAAASAAAGLTGAALGGLGVLYARGRSDGARDEVIAQHGRALTEHAASIAALTKEHAVCSVTLAVLAQKVDGIALSVEETRDLVRDLSKRR